MSEFLTKKLSRPYASNRLLAFSENLKITMAAGFAGCLLLASPASAIETDGALVETPAIAEAAEADVCNGHGSIWWNEIVSSDMVALKSFYREVIGWQTKDLPPAEGEQLAAEDRYTLMQNGTEEIAGLSADKKLSAENPNALGWRIYIQVRDVEKTVETARLSGGKIIEEPEENDDGDITALVQDPNGHVFGLITPAAARECGEHSTQLVE